MNSKVIELSRKMRHVNRFSTFPLLRPYNDAEHSFGVGVIGSALIKEQAMLRPSLWPAERQLLLLEECLHHDIHEGRIGDILYDVKRYSTEMNEMIKKMETEVEIAAGFHRIDDKNCVRVLRAADMADIVYHLREEYQMGNHHPAIESLLLFALSQVYHFARRLDSALLADMFNETVEMSLRAPSFTEAALASMMRCTLGHSKVIVQSDADSVMRSKGKPYQGNKLMVWEYEIDHSKYIDHIENDAHVTWGIPICIFHQGAPIRAFACRNFDFEVLLYNIENEPVGELPDVSKLGRWITL